MRPCDQHRLCLVALSFALAITAGCGKSEDKKAATQVAAKVNSDEITVHQINNILARAPNVTPEVAERAKREILDKLIDAEVARQEAIAKKLDRTPATLQLLEASKTEILARAYVEQVATAQPKPTPDEVKKYYVEHPELFSQRRVYSIEEITLAAKEGLAASLRAQAAKSRSLREIADSLKSQGIQFAANSGVRAAEQLPLDFLPQMQTMKDGEIRVFEAAGGLQIIRVAASKPGPVDEERAAPRINQFLFTRRSAEAITADMKQLKEKAKIEYMGEFVASAEEAQAKAKAAAEAKAKAAVEAKGKAAAEAEAKADQISKARAAAEARAKGDDEAQAKADELARARRAAEAKARLEAESKDGKAVKPPSPDIEKGVRGIIR